MVKAASLPGISVVMPVFNYGNFIRRAIVSLLEQTFETWELIIVNDGSTDNTSAVIAEFASDKRIKVVTNSENRGLGTCLNQGIRIASFSLVSYLPADDIYYRDHLQQLWEALLGNPDAVLAHSGVRHHYNRTTPGIVEGNGLQLVQVLHHKGEERWMERDELVTDDLGRMYWNKLKSRGEFVSTGKISCEWVDHPHQRHKILQEPIGGINPYKQKYNVRQPLRFHTTKGNYIDEVSYYEQFRSRQSVPVSEGLKILLVGELAYNPERILALEEHGHKLYGLWMREPYWYNFVGPLPFGNVEDIPFGNWKQRVREIEPDIIYALLNWQAVPFCHEVLRAFPDIPFVWHFKEGPFICLEKGTWKEMIDLYEQSDAQIYCSEEMQVWTEQFLNEDKRDSMILDGDLPKREWFREDVSPLLSDKDGAIHTVVPGRPIGLHPHTVVSLAEQNIHLHFYADFTHGQWKEWIEKTNRLAPGFLHIHPNCSQDQWTKEFSQYDAGWLHFFRSDNHGEIMRANWDDLNIPARMATLAVAGLPMLQYNNAGHVVATQSLASKHDLGIFIDDIMDLATLLRDKAHVKRIRDNVWSKRNLFMFDHYVSDLVQFFRNTIEKKKISSGRRGKRTKEISAPIGSVL
jgi:glycosyltransferase involved in cell wall biosynthesis